MTTTFAHPMSMDNLQLLVGNIPLPISDVAIHGTIDGSGVVWVVGVEFTNVLETVADGVFNIPLPHRGAVSAMTMYVGDRVIAADIKEREQARIEFQEAKERGQTAALFEQQRAEIFTMSVGSLQPGQNIRVEVVVHDGVAVDGTEASVRFPTMIKDRYVPDVPDVEIFDNLQIADSTPTAHVHVDFASPAIDIVCDTGDKVTMGTTSVSSDVFALTGDFALRWSLPMNIATAKWVPDSADSNMGTLEVNIRVPKTKETPRRKKAIQIMFDRSGSMRTHYLDWARHVASQVIAQLDGNDLIHIATFDSDIEALESTQFGFVPATRQVKKSLLAELLTITARGGTELTEALQAMGASFGTLDDVDDSDEYERIAVLITDGAYGDEATAAFHRENELKGARVIAVAIGENANGFLEVLAANGVCVFVQSEVTLHEATSKVLSRIAAPALRGVFVEYEGLTNVTPQFRPDVYPELLKTVSGRVARPVGDTKVSVMSSDGLVMEIPVVLSQDSSTTSRWAGNYIKTLDYQMMSNVDNDTDATDLEKQIIELSITHKVLSKYTAWLAIDTETNTVREVTRTVNPLRENMFTGDFLAHTTYRSVFVQENSVNLSVNALHFAPRQIFPTQQPDSFDPAFLDKLKNFFKDDDYESATDDNRESKLHWFIHLLATIRALLHRMFRRKRQTQIQRRR